MKKKNISWFARAFEKISSQIATMSSTPAGVRFSSHSTDKAQYLYNLKL